MFSVNVLMFGQHHSLAVRCLESIIQTADWSLISDVRVGLNAVGRGTHDYVQDASSRVKAPLHVYREESDKNVMKYPLMRRMLYDHERPIEAPYVMWFDDDSYIGYDTTPAWWATVAGLFTPGIVAVGSKYRPAYDWNVHEKAAIAAAPWYDGCALTTRPLFCTGGWWAARKEFLAEWDYPFRELRHNGGDVILGELIRQRGRAIAQFNTGVRINADATGRESAAARRGVTTARPFQAPPPYAYDHHDFRCVVESYNARVPKCPS